MFIFYICVCVDKIQLNPYYHFVTRFWQLCYIDTSPFFSLFSGIYRHYFREKQHFKDVESRKIHEASGAKFVMIYSWHLNH